MTKGEKTRTKIIEAAIEVFSKVGFQWASFQLIGDAVGVSQPAIYGHFKDKDDLLRACCLTVVQRGQAFIDARIDEFAPAQKRLHSYVAGNLKWVLEKPKEANVLLAVYYYGSTNKTLQELHSQIDLQGIRRIKLHLTHLFRESGQGYPEARNLDRLIHSLLVGEMIKALHWPKEVSEKKRLQNTIGWIEHIVGH